MPTDYLHNHKQFPDLIRIVAEQKGIDPALVEKDYWIMHSLYGLQKLGLTFELKGGTSLSKGYKIIDRFSEDIDIHIDPPTSRNVKTGRNQDKPAHVKSRKDFYDWLADTKIKIDGIDTVERDTAFDSEKLFSGGIRLRYLGFSTPINDLKDGILLEAGFDAVAPSFAGHELCTAQPFVQGFEDAAPLHPTAAGEIAIALADEQALLNPPPPRPTGAATPSPS